MTGEITSKPLPTPKEPRFPNWFLLALIMALIGVIVGTLYLPVTQYQMAVILPALATIGFILKSMLR